MKAIPVFLASMLKFILGPLGGFASKLHFVTTAIVTILGMMTIVVALTYFGEWIKTRILDRFFKKRKTFTPHHRFAGIWKKYGLVGVALLTPIILTPIGGTLLALSSGSPREKIIFYMLVSASTWSVIFTGAVYLFGREVLPDFVK